MVKIEYALLKNDDKLTFTVRQLKQWKKIIQKETLQNLNTQRISSSTEPILPSKKGQVGKLNLKGGRKKQ